jgi:hypothetical protein
MMTPLDEQDGGQDKAAGETGDKFFCKKKRPGFGPGHFSRLLF